MRFFPSSRIGLRLGLGLAVAVIGMPLAVEAAELGMLDSLAKGAWNLRIRDDGSERKVCVRSGRELIQIRHKEQGCSRFVVRDRPDEVVVQYTCRGNGYGRTTIRRENSDLVQIQSQGIVDGAPFAISGEARRGGAC